MCPLESLGLLFSHSRCRIVDRKKKVYPVNQLHLIFFLKIPICSDISKAVSSDISFSKDIGSFMACLETGIAVDEGLASSPTVHTGIC